MAMTFDEMVNAVNDAESTLNRAKSFMSKMGRMIVAYDRIKQLDPSTLDSLKKQLRNWDMSKKEWKQ